MKKLFIITLLLFTGITVLAQKKCKPKIDITDKKTGVHTVRFGGSAEHNTMLYGTGEYQTRLYLQHEEGVNYIMLVVDYSYKLGYNEQIQRQWYEKGCSFILKFGDEDILFETQNSHLINKKGKSHAVLLAYLTNDVLDVLSNKTIKEISIFPFKGNQDNILTVVPSGKNASKLLNQFNCFKEQEYEITGKVKNNKKAETYAKLGLKRIEAKDFTKALSYVEKSLNEVDNNGVLAVKCLLLLALNKDSSNTKEEYKAALNDISKKSGKAEVFDELESLLILLMDSYPENEKLDDYLTILMEY